MLDAKKVIGTSLTSLRSYLERVSLWAKPGDDILDLLKEEVNQAERAYSWVSKLEKAAR